MLKSCFPITDKHSDNFTVDKKKKKKKKKVPVDHQGR